VEHENIATVRSYIEAVWNGDTDAADDYVTPDTVTHPAWLSDRERRGADELNALVQSYREAFPDLRVSLLDVFGEGDRVLARTTWHGTHQGDLAGIAATGKPVILTALTIHRLENGRIAETWPLVDLLNGLQQLGVASRE
jgi:steroid delta-isomerase-like uncharacterized protein